MELDDFKGLVLGEPEPQKEANAAKKDDLGDLIGELKAADAKDLKNTRLFILSMGTFVVIYCSALLRNHGSMKDGYAMLVLGFVLTLLYLFLRHRKVRTIDYSAPAIQFLKEAGQRYRFMSPVDWLFTTPALLLLVTGGGIIIKTSFLKYFGSSCWPLVIYSVLMASTVVVGFWSGIRFWKRDKRDILEKIRKMEEEFGK